MSAADLLLPVGLAIGQLGLDAARGEHATPEAVARKLIELGLRLVPREQLLAFLTPTGIAAAELLADVAERERFPGG